MSQKLPNMLETTIQKIREMLDVNTVVGTPITTPDGVTIIPVSKVSVGFGGGGSDFASKAPIPACPTVLPVSASSGKATSSRWTSAPPIRATALT